MEVALARTEADFRRQIIRFAQQLGFNTISATAALDDLNGVTHFSVVDNTPSDFLTCYGDESQRRRDPVLQYCKNNSIPIAWDQSTYALCGQGSKWEEQAKYGYQVGIALALHLPEGRHFLIGVDRDRPLPKNSSELTQMVAHLQLFAVYAQEAASRLLLPQLPQRDVVKLTPRERDCLLWTLEGKTAWETGQILSLSERTVAGHLGIAMRKLGCVSKAQAVAKALRLGLLELRH
jgi:DNA-binding CsgD family transcriptional regulator